jgi:hypothetical protein
METLDIIALSITLVLYVAYHITLFLILRYIPHRTVLGITKAARSKWEEVYPFIFLHNDYRTSWKHETLYSVSKCFATLFGKVWPRLRLLNQWRLSLLNASSINKRRPI